ncbi:MAG TPA: AAA family ATPase [Dehalococcoidia bacterium]
MSSATTTILFTDLVNSTELLQRAGDESAQRIFESHHRLLSDAVSAHGGQEVKWLGDGLMVAFPSAADAVRCAISMQQASRRSSAGARIDVRVGLNVGDTLRNETDYFGTPVVIAKRLCDRANAGQIICSALVAGLLSSRQAFAFDELGALELKGIASPVAACEVVYGRDEATSFFAHTPFVGRAVEVERLNEKMRDVRSGRGGLVMVVGEPGIGKTRTCDEFASRARDDGAVVLRGRCFEGEWTPPYAPFAEAIADHATAAQRDELAKDLGYGAAAVARIAPAIRDALPGVGDAPALQPDEERFRLLDAVSQFLIALSERQPVLLMLDDLHWADRGTIAMMRHVARFAPKHRILVLGAYRDVELDRQHPLADALSALRREVEYERIALKGLAPDEVRTLIETIGEQDANPALVQAISDETEGNPFFVREVLLHLVEEGKLYREDGEWRSTAQTIADLGIPEGVRQVITRRLSRLSDTTNRLLTAASAFNGGFRFDVVSAIAGIDDASALDALDDALDAQLVRAAGADAYDFTHALIRHTLYGEMNPSRQVRLHRQIAEAMERAYADRANDHAAELAYQYHRSAAVPGADRGVLYALAAADSAALSGAFDEAVSMLEIALELMPDGDARRPATLGTLGTTLAWALRGDEALKTCLEAAQLIASSGGDAAAYLADASSNVFGGGFTRNSWELARVGLTYAGDRRDLTWARLMSSDLMRREAADPDNPGIPLPSPEREEAARIAMDDPSDSARQLLLSITAFALPVQDRAGAIALERSVAYQDNPYFASVMKLFWIGDYRLARQSLRVSADAEERAGLIAPAVGDWAFAARAAIALGDFDEANAAIERSTNLAQRLTSPSMFTIQLVGAVDERCVAMGDGFEDLLASMAPLASAPDAENAWVMGAVRAGVARVLAYSGQGDAAIGLLTLAMPSIERAQGGASNYTRIVCAAAETLWVLERTDHAEALERNLREKVVGPDFRYVMHDGRLALARVCALQGKHDEASHWFAESRRVLEEDGVRPLRAIADYDEALMYARRGADGDADRARPLLDAAMVQFREIGMTGWLRRGEELGARL